MSGAFVRASIRALVRAGPVALAGLLFPGCAQRDDLVAFVVSSAPDGGVPDAAEPFHVVGRPWNGRWPFPIAVWPLAASLRDFFASVPEDGRRIEPQGTEREALWGLRASAAAGEFGPSRDAVVVEDHLGDRYLVTFSTDSE